MDDSQVQRDLMRWLLAWVLYGLGHGAWLVIRWLPISSWVLATPYQKLMAWSCAMQGPTARGPWSEVLA